MVRGQRCYPTCVSLSIYWGCDAGLLGFQGARTSGQEFGLLYRVSTVDNLLELTSQALALLRPSTLRLPYLNHCGHDFSDGMSQCHGGAPESETPVVPILTGVTTVLHQWLGRTSSCMALDPSSGKIDNRYTCCRCELEGCGTCGRKKTTSVIFKQHSLVHARPDL